MLVVPDFQIDPNCYPDSGATNHLSPDENNLMAKNEFYSTEKIHMGNGAGLLIKHIGQSHFSSRDKTRLLYLNYLLHVPNITKNLISVSKFAKDNKCFFEFHPSACF
ncbi:hypothetical protein PanWU01x14_306510 [Parasponia andersonii]|uniref:Retrovirus-related Pol polyprotein from transposon TNT 1-94-like beta-barrel domain-containing protein n=1 Tax=Parasponia andersonii TaxID=3476 RepID=A0A2P5ART9_PARAD|nr:hypothetical protein PanWU01x14_306510 [Parasponia andersonii]